MDAVIRVRLSELDASLIGRLKSLFQDRGDLELTISFDDSHNYNDTLQRSKNDLELGNNLITFDSIEDLESYSLIKRL